MREVLKDDSGTKRHSLKLKIITIVDGLVYNDDETKEYVHKIK